MQSSPAVRCQHIRTSGTQCGSPALRHRKHCYYHQHWRPVVVNLSEPGKRAHFTLPILEDAHSIQFAITQIMHQLIDKTIDTKTAGLMLYALQIASSNLKQLQAETPPPSQVVVDPDDVADTPLQLDAVAGEVKPESATKKSSKGKKDEPSEAKTQRMLDYLICLGKHLDDPCDKYNPELERLKNLAYMEDEEIAKLPPGTIQACATTAENEQRRERLH